MCGLHGDLLCVCKFKHSSYQINTDMKATQILEEHTKSISHKSYNVVTIKKNDIENVLLPLRLILHHQLVIKNQSGNLKSRTV